MKDVQELARIPQLSRQEIIDYRRTYLSPVLQTFCNFPDDPVTVVRGKGQYLFDADGKKYLDCTGQNMSNSIGMHNPVTVAMMEAQSQRTSHITTLLFNDMPGLYAKELVEHLPKEQEWVVHLVCSGAEALDLAFMMARAYTGNFDMLYLRDAYHGLHGSPMGACGFSTCRQPMPNPPGFVSVIRPNQYRPLLGPGIEPYVSEIEESIAQNTCGRIAGMVIEPIQGMGGVVPMPEGYMARAAEVVRKAGGLLISDEVQTGFGRTGKHFWGFEAHNVVPEIVAMGKGIGNGMPIAAVAVRRDIAEAFTKARFFNTMASHPVACASALSVLRVVDDWKLMENALHCEERLRQGMGKLQEQYEVIGDIRGSGLIMGFEFVTDRKSKTPGTELCRKIIGALREEGILIACVWRRNVFRINPALTVTMEDMDHIIHSFEKALKKYV